MSEKDLLTGWAEGNKLMLGHADLVLDTPVGGVATAADDDDVGGAWFSLSPFFFFLLLVFLRTPHCFLFLFLDNARG